MPNLSGKRVTVVGGCGHVGLPLSIVLAQYHEVDIYDIDERAVALVRSGVVPFQEEGASEELKLVLGRTLRVGSDPSSIAKADYVVLVIGTPVDEHLNPDFTLFHKVLGQLAEHLHTGQTLVLRSTVYPGTTKQVAQLLKRRGLDIEVVFCPERVAEGFAIREIRDLPQLVAGFSRAGVDSARALFEPFVKELVELEPSEAELAKLFTNVWRYISFAVPNQFYMIAREHGLDYTRIQAAMKHNYPRTAGLPKPGFAAGPCLFKDTMQLAAFGNNHFFLGHAAMLVNEGMPGYVVAEMKRAHPDLGEKRVGILGMAFKPGSDDPRESLSYKLKKILAVEALEVLTTDPRVADADLLPYEEVLRRADILVVGVPHVEYASLDVGNKPIFNIWK
ncbi:MAG TPA: nucleotide sugar dehydrogenase [Polyangiaceae bacterium]